MHDMRIAFNVHKLFDVDGSGFGDTTHIIASQVYQHDMFGPFLRVC